LIRPERRRAHHPAICGQGSSRPTALLPYEKDRTLRAEEDVPGIATTHRRERKACMSSSSKRRQTMAKMTRERTVKERRARKQEKKEERKQAAAERAANADGALQTDTVDDQERSG
jgi:hypothetical protein